MEGTIHIVGGGYYPIELWIEGKDVVRMEKTSTVLNRCLLKIKYADGHSEVVSEPIILEFIGQIPKEVEVTETPQPPADGYENDKLMVVYEEIDRMEIAEREQQKIEHPHWNGIQKNGNGMRFLNVAKSNNIETVGQLLKFGRERYERLKYMGPRTVAIVSKALKNLYGIETW